MSSLTPRFEGQLVTYVVQSGVVAWEDLKPKADWTSKTVTACAANATLLTVLLKEVLSSESFGRRSIFRCHLSAIPAPQNALQKRRLEGALRAAAPGFGEALVTFGDGFAVTVAEAIHVHNIQLAYLSSYRQTVLVAADRGLTPATVAGIFLGLTLPFDGRTISGLRTERSSLVVLRTLEEESQYVFQIVCDPVTSDSVAKVMDEMGVRRSLDRVAASEAIGVIPRGNA